DRIFPEVQAQEPRARLTIVGRRPPSPLVRRVGHMAGVDLHADVDDVRPYLARSAVMAVPLRIGGGSRLKILESLAAGLPVVSTQVGAEGLELTPGEDFELVERAEEMAPALVQSICEPERSRRLAEHGRKIVLARYDWDV